MKLSLPLKLLLIIIALMGVSVLSYTIKTEAWTDQLNSVLVPIYFSGTWKSESSPTPQTIVDNTIPDNKKSTNVTLRGHFDEKIEADASLLLRVSNVRLQIYQNDKKIYSFGDPGTYPELSKSPDDQWEVFTPPYAHHPGRCHHH